MVLFFLGGVVDVCNQLFQDLRSFQRNSVSLLGISSGKIGEKERNTRILINNLTKGIQVNISFRLVNFISSFMLTDL